MLSNRIAFNGGAGISVESGTGNRLWGNSIFSNVGLGIDLGANGVTPNNSQGHVGPNNYQNFPVLSTVTGGTQTQITGTLQGAPGTYRLDFYASASSDPSGQGEGERWLGSVTVTVGGSGVTNFRFLVGSSKMGEFITATATDLQGNTSEFSNALLVTKTK